MAYSTMSPFVFGEVVTAGRINQFIDNDEALRDGSGLSNGIITPSKLDLDPAGTTVATLETTTSTTYTDLATAGPASTITVGANGIVLLFLSCELFTSGTFVALMSVTLSGANSLAAADTLCIRNGSGTDMELSYATLLTGLNAGSTTFTAKYRVSGGTGNWARRKVIPVPL